MSLFGQINSDEIVNDLDLQNPIPAATINLTILAGHNTYAKWTAGEDETVNVSSGTPSFGDEFTAIITNDGVAPRTITFGTKFITSGTIVGTISTTSTIKFISDGINYYEVSRTINIS